MRRWLARRLRALLARDTLERELDDELRFHLDQEFERNRGAGMSEREARAAALRAFGGVEQVKEEARDARGVRLWEELWQDLRHGLRMMKKAPGFTAVAVLSLALGIGANTALFSVIDSVLLRRLPVEDPDRLVLLEWEAGAAFRTDGISGYGVNGRHPPGRQGSSSFARPVFERLRQQDGPVATLFAFAPLDGTNVTADDGQAEVIDGQLVSGDYFPALGVRALLGRTLGPADDRPAADPAVVLSHRYWQTRFGGAPDVIGKRIGINRVSFTIVGVMPASFTGTLQVTVRPQVTVPLAFHDLVKGNFHPGEWWLHLMGRLRPGATPEQARQSLSGSFQEVALQLMPAPERGHQAGPLGPGERPTLVVRAGSRGMTEHRQILAPPLFLLFGVVVMVLLIACANVANMLLARSAARRPEISIRLAMGAGRGRIIRQLITESLLLSALAGAVGAAVGVAGKQALAALAGSLPPEPATLLDFHLRWPVFAFTAGLSLLTGLVFGLTPALRATRHDLSTALKAGSRSVGGVARSRLSKSLVMAQVAVSIVLLFGAALFVRTARNLQQVDVGFNQRGLLVFSLRPGSLGYEGDRLQQLYQRIFARLDGLSGVRSATFSFIPPLAASRSTTRIAALGRDGGRQRGSANVQVVRENYFEAMEIPLLAGRRFNDQDRPGADRVAIVNQSLARAFFPDQDPIGQRLVEPPVVIVGLVRDTKYSSQREPMTPLLYTPWRQDRRSLHRMSFAVRTAGEPLALAGPIRRAIAEVDPALPVTGLTTQLAQSRRTFAIERLVAGLLGLFGGLAALLAAIGLYGVMAYAVVQRTSEIGIRMALGARAAGVLRMVVRQGLTLAAVGVVVGSLASFGLGRVIAGQLYGVGAGDPPTLLAVGLGLLAVAFVACWIPARRATRIDPVIALRSE
jgi:predicted permease